MRRALPIAVVAMMAIGVSAALAASTTYSGAVKGGGKLQVFVKKSLGVREISRFDFQHIGLKCNGNHRAATGNLRKKYKPKVADDGSFKIRGDNHLGGIVRINGTLKHHGRAKGTVRLDGAFQLDGSSQLTKHCHSGLKHWTAQRG